MTIASLDRPATAGAALLRDVLSNPLDAELRGMYADYLEEQGQDSAPWRVEPSADRLDSLTPPQVALLPLLRDYWLGVGLATGPCDRAAAWEAACAAYEVAGLKRPKVQVWLDSPLAGAVGAEQMRSLVSDLVQVWGQVRGQVYRCGYGQHDAGWLCFYSALYLFGAASAVRLAPLITLAHCCGWWWPFEDAVVFTERPVIVEMQNKKLVRIQYRDGFEAKGK